MNASVNLKNSKNLKSGGKQIYTKQIYTRTMYLTMSGNEWYSQKTERKSDRKSGHMVLQMKTNSTSNPKVNLFA